MHPPAAGNRRAGIQEPRPSAAGRPAKAGRYAGIMYSPGAFRKAKSISVGVLLDGYAVVHLVDPEDLGVAAVRAELVVLAHDERLDGLGRAHLGALVAEAAALGAGAGLGLETEHPAEARRRRAALGRILEREGRLRRVLQRDP